MEFNQLGKTAIPGENPGGLDARYEPEFEAVQAEIDRLSSPTASGQVNWDRIVENGAVLLNTKSKDLTIACYMAVALVSTRKIDGLDEGMQVLADLVESFWDSLYPPKKRMRGRLSAIQWWLERTQTELQKLAPPPIAPEQSARLVESLQRLDAALSAYLPDAPVLRPLQRQIESIPVQAVQAPAANPAPSASGAYAATAPAAPAASVPSAASPMVEKNAGEESLSGAITNVDEARRAADAALQRLRETSLFLLQHDLKNPLAYRFRRMAGWAKLTLLPSNADGNTQIVQPPPQVVSAVETLCAEGNWPALIQHAEPKTSQYLFWFDLQRHVALALDALGRDYRKASEAVCQETAMLLERLPGLETLRFVNGMPFADAESLQWLKSIRAAGAGLAPTIPMQGAGSGEADTTDAVLQKAISLAQKRNLPEAMNLLQQEMLGCAAYGCKMRWRMAIARLLLEVKRPQLAMLHLERIVSDIDAYGLETWDPPLAVDGLSMAWQALTALNDKAQKDRAMMLLQRIAGIDPSTALRLGQ